MGYLLGAAGVLVLTFIIVVLVLEPLVQSRERPSARTQRGPRAGSVTQP